jgi:hypothetical protein
LRVLSAVLAALVGFAEPALAGPPEPRLPARLRDIGGRSGKLLAFIETREGLSELEGAGLRVTIEEPGVYPFQWPEGWPAARAKTGASVILLTPFSDKRDGRIGDYVLGRWPNEGSVKDSSAAGAYAATRARTRCRAGSSR